MVRPQQTQQIFEVVRPRNRQTVFNQERLQEFFRRLLTAETDKEPVAKWGQTPLHSGGLTPFCHRLKVIFRWPAAGEFGMDNSPIIREVDGKEDIIVDIEKPTG